MFIDAHVHVGEPPPEAEMESLVKLMEESGVDRSVVCRYIPGKPTLRGNQLVRSAVKEYPNRFVGFVWINPNRDTAVEEIEKAIKDWGFRGIKLHLETTPAPPTKIGEVFEEAERLEVPVYVHTGKDLDVVDNMSETFNVDIILGHLGVGVYSLDPNRLEKSIELVKKHEDIYAETSGNTYYFIEYAVKKLGSSEVIFGSDFPHEHPLVLKKAIEILDIPQEEKSRILGGNIRQLIGI